jgi:hypothetical protein
MGLEMTYRAIAPGTILYQAFGNEPRAAFYFTAEGFEKLSAERLD